MKRWFPVRKYGDTLYPDRYRVRVGDWLMHWSTMPSNYRPAVRSALWGLVRWHVGPSSLTVLFGRLRVEVFRALA